MTSAVGLLLAAGAGRRMGTPKALVRGADGTPWLLRSLHALRDGGCSRLVVVLGAAADDARVLLEQGADADGLGAVEVVVASQWHEGMGASLRAGLLHLGAPDPAGTAAADEVAVVSLVDLPDVGADVVGRLLATVDPTAPDGGPGHLLARAAYRGVAGHPVLLGAHHWAAVAAVASGDRGARDYLAVHRPTLVECGDLATGGDVDTPEAVSHLSQRPSRG